MTGRRAKHNERGFTLVELVTILVLVGILAVVALPRVTDMSVFQEKGFSARWRPPSASPGRRPRPPASR